MSGKMTNSCITVLLVYAELLAKIALKFCTKLKLY